VNFFKIQTSASASFEVDQPFVVCSRNLASAFPPMLMEISMTLQRIYGADYSRNSFPAVVHAGRIRQLLLSKAKSGKHK
jgi:hypothetical protein